MYSLYAKGSPLSSALTSQSPEDLTKVFLRLFSNRLGSAVRRKSDGTWREVSQYHYLSDAEIIAALQKDSSLMRAFRLDEQTNFFVVSIAEDSPNKTISYANSLRATLKSINVSSCFYEFKGEWFFWIYINRRMDTDNTAVKLRSILTGSYAGSKLEGVTVHDTSSFIPFPLQPGFVWLNEKSEQIVGVEKLELCESIACFLAEASNATSDADQFLEGLSKRRSISKPSSFVRSLPVSNEKRMSYSTEATKEKLESSQVANKIEPIESYDGGIAETDSCPDTTFVTEEACSTSIIELNQDQLSTRDFACLDKGTGPNSFQPEVSNNNVPAQLLLFSKAAVPRALPSHQCSKRGESTKELIGGNQRKAIRPPPPS